MKILLAGDEEDLAKVLREKLEKEKFVVAATSDGAAVVSMAKSGKPDLIILDLILPKKDGLAVLQELKDDAEVKAISVIVLSSVDDDDKIKEGLDLGAADYLVKTQHPVNEIVDKVKDFMLKIK
jgi:two-component system alkaline phosphatase synthesis response regulator PhoP